MAAQCEGERRQISAVALNDKVRRRRHVVEATFNNKRGSPARRVVARLVWQCRLGARTYQALDHLAKLAAVKWVKPLDAEERDVVAVAVDEGQLGVGPAAQVGVCRQQVGRDDGPPRTRLKQTASAGAGYCSGRRHGAFAARGAKCSAPGCHCARRGSRRCNALKAAGVGRGAGKTPRQMHA